MYLTKFTDYSFRVLIYLAKDKNKVFIVEDLSKELKISEHHLKKIIHKLAKTEVSFSINDLYRILSSLVITLIRNCFARTSRGIIINIIYLGGSHVYFIFGIYNFYFYKCYYFSC